MPDREQLTGFRMGSFVFPLAPSDHDEPEELEPPVVFPIHVLPDQGWQSLDGDEMEAIANGEEVPVFWTGTSERELDWPMADFEERSRELVDLMHDLELEQGRERPAPPEPNDEPPNGECKVEGCHEPYLAQKGIYGRLCERHKEAAQAVRQRMVEEDRKVITVPPEELPDGELVRLAREVEQTRQEFVDAARALRAALEELES